MIAEGLCAACHNADGNSVSAPLQPKLASQHMAYLEKQMHDFKRPKVPKSLCVAKCSMTKATINDGRAGQDCCPKIRNNLITT